jgi:AcrR family transcriptional regulator
MSGASATERGRSPGEGPGSAVRPPGRPRSAEADTAIIRATLHVLVSDGYRALTMEKVRAVAGVGKATVYRRYGSKEELVRAAVAHLHQELPLPPDTGSVRGDFKAVAESARASAEAAEWLTFMPRMLAEVAHDPELRALFHDALVGPRRSVLTAVLRRGIERGEIRADVDLDLAVDLVTGPVIYRIIITGGDLGQMMERPLQVLDAVLEGLRPR